jgi:hypothetical protein
MVQRPPKFWQLHIFLEYEVSFQRIFLPPNPTTLPSFGECFSAFGSRKGPSPFVGALLRELLSMDLEGYREEGSVYGHHSPWGPRWGI